MPVVARSGTVRGAFPPQRAPRRHRGIAGDARSGGGKRAVAAGGANRRTLPGLKACQRLLPRREVLKKV
jgi:hypothetical protein